MIVKKKIKIKFLNGLELCTFKREVFDINGISEHFDFELSDNPDFIIFGPYGNNIPIKGDYKRIGYFCENVTPDLSICNWAFGIPLEAEINNPKYRRIQWHGFDPNKLVKNFSDNDIDRIINSRNRFCNFLYSNPVPYREDFFKQLSKYKRIDAPGKSMNNMPSIDSKDNGYLFTQKNLFISHYKFTIAFENYVYPGYQTEKLYDSMYANSLPIYCGDEHVNDIFNHNSFLNALDFVNVQKNAVVNYIQKNSQPNFTDLRPSFYKSPINRMQRKLKYIGRSYSMNRKFKNVDFSPLIDRVIEIDNNVDLYAKYLKEPWLKQNQIPITSSSRDTWLSIFNS